jgi:uncharacterized protein YhaN
VFPEDPRPAFERLERRRDAARDEREIASARHAETNARLEVKNASGPYEAFVLAEAEFCELRERLQETEREARAARLLRETLLGVEADREAGILAPVRKRTAELYGRVTAQAPGALHFNSDLTFSGMDVGGVRLLQTLSAGEREQLQMVARLALADLVTGEERQLVILDDTVRDTDPRRFARFLALIQEFSRERMQFVITTCDKARYLGLEGAAFIDLEALRRPLAVA